MEAISDTSLAPGLSWSLIEDKPGQEMIGVDSCLKSIDLKVHVCITYSWESCRSRRSCL